ncbi:TPM domain-containing protein [Corynebacterium phoceense]|uniref:TPM domain-containing protein n=1 Tax=Corynebacterium phoceense TaxID=1686286 RepID=UPI00211C8D87|nr:TPM domain-containing protein [Corynebacterium phoceense]MCQ9337265.1 TPM domain-containing protein [Corynebacterium phoceense]
MTFSRVGRAAVAALLIGLGTGAPAVFLCTAVAQAAPAASSITAKVTDDSGVLSSSQKSDLESQIAQLQSSDQRLLYVVYTTGLDSQVESYAESIVNARGTNTAAFVVDTQARKATVSVGSEWPSGSQDSLYEAAYDSLAASDWAGAGSAVVEAASGSSGSGDGALWLGAGGAAVLAAGGGAYAMSRRKTKKETAATVESAREIEPTDTSALARLPLPVLEELAQEELVSTDESIRRGKEELDIAIAEFGPERARKFTAAMNQSTSTLQRAFATHKQIEAQRGMPEAQKRELLVSIVSSCGQADDALDAQAAEFASMRDLLVNAGSKLDELTQKTVDLRARMPQATETLDSLREQYSEQMLQSIADNPQMASVSLDEAEKSLALGRSLESKPAGQQGGLVGAIRDSEHATEVADRLLSAVENAQSTITTAQQGLSALIAEVDGEVAEARQIEAQGQSQGTSADWASLEALLSEASAATFAARSGGAADPLGHYTTLMSLDGRLDEALDTVREVTQTHARQLDMFAQQISVASSTIQAAEDLISARGRLVGASARTALEDAKRLHAQALQQRDRDIRSALDLARQAVAAAQEAQRRAQNDIDDYRRRQQRQQMASGAGDLITGMVIGQMLGGGGHRGGYGGGFGGGFGGGGFGGGGFSGGGGGSRTGAF